MNTNDEPQVPSTPSATEVPPAPPVSSTPPVRRLYRLPDHGPLAGVAAGLGAYFNIDPILVRLGFLALALTTGPVGVLLYGIGWLVIPAATPDEAARQASPRAWDRADRWVGVGLILLALVWLTGVFAIVSPPMIAALVLMGVGVVLLRQDAAGRAQPEGDGSGWDADGPVEAAASGWDPDAGEWEPGASAWGAGTENLGREAASWGDDPADWERRDWSPPAVPAAAGTGPATRPAAPARRRSLLGRVTAGAALLVTGAAVAVDNLGWLNLAPRHYLALLLTVVGAGLLVGAWWGRARGLIAVGLLLVPLLVVASALGPPVGWGGGMGERAYQPHTLADVADTYRLGAGELRVDLSDVTFADDPTTVRVRQGFGEVTVVVPDDVHVDVRARAGAGEIVLFGEGTAGTGLERSVTEPGDDGRLVLDVAVNAGPITVRRAGDGPVGR